MRFLHVGWLWSAALLPLLWILLRLADGAARQRLARAFGDRAGSHVESRHDHLRQWRRFFLLAGIFWLLVALARPQWGAREIEHTQRGVDLVVALDISNSMRADDVAPDRIGLARAELTALLDGYDRGRVGLVLFAGRAFVQCPLTLDLGTLTMFLRMADPDMISAQGTALGSALETAVSLLDDGSEAETRLDGRVILLVTDGEDLEGGWERAVERCRESGIVVLALGVGSPEGGLVPEITPDGGDAGYIKDEQGNVVMSRLDMDALRHVAEGTGGEARRIGVSGLDREAFGRALDALNDRDLSSRRVSEYNDRFVWPLLLSWLSLAAGALLRPRRSVLAAALVLAGLAVAPAPVAATPFAPPGSAAAREGLDLYLAGEWERALDAFEAARSLNPDDPRLSLAVGEVLNRMQRFEEAEREFQRARALTEDPDIRAESLYNSGTNHLTAGEPDKAIASLRESLALSPEQPDALDNLEHAIRMMQQPPQQQQQDDQQQDDQQQGDESQDRSESSEQQQGDEQQQQQQPGESEEDQDDQERQEQQAREDDASEEQQPPEPSPAAADSQAVDQEMDRQRALDMLRSLDRDEEELRKSIQKRLRGEPTRSGKRW